ncbi:hypothetical protein F2Q68_00011207 [Brassica cretica]|uniref:Uncharacterized protein n=1 Tax=Brassica cretica TaxID=69181 RepID=A0A8S9KYH1_BRACR|nr:hypothetical protein F2Q68_00011207 [Brassica cretica]
MFLELGLPFVCRLLKPDHQANLELDGCLERAPTATGDVRRLRSSTSWSGRRRMRAGPWGTLAVAVRDAS